MSSSNSRQGTLDSGSTSAHRLTSLAPIASSGDMGLAYPVLDFLINFNFSMLPLLY